MRARGRDEYRPRSPENRAAARAQRRRQLRLRRLIALVVLIAVIALLAVPRRPRLQRPRLEPSCQREPGAHACRSAHAAGRVSRRLGGRACAREPAAVRRAGVKLERMVRGRAQRSQACALAVVLTALSLALAAVTGGCGSGGTEAPEHPFGEPPAPAPGVHAWAAGEVGDLLVTADGGATWKRQRFLLPQRGVDVTFTDARTGWLVTDAGTVLASTDGGAGWTVVEQVKARPDGDRRHRCRPRVDRRQRDRSRRRARGVRRAQDHRRRGDVEAHRLRHGPARRRRLRRRAARRARRARSHLVDARRRSHLEAAPAARA